jgi:hypothetical protein
MTDPIRPTVEMLRDSVRPEFCGDHIPYCAYGQCPSWDGKYCDVNGEKRRKCDQPEHCDALIEFAVREHFERHAEALKAEGKE